MHAILRLISLFSAAERRRLAYLTAAVLLMAVLEVAGIGAIGPFMAVVANPGLIETQPQLSLLYHGGQFSSYQAFITALGIALFVLILVTNAFRMLTIYAIHRFIGMRRYSLGLRLFRRYLHQPYAYFLDHNSAELSKNILSEVDFVMSGVLLPAMEGFARAVVVVGIVVFLLILNPLLALFTCAVLSVAYFGLFRFVRPRLNRYGEELRSSNQRRYKATAEAFGAIKDVKVLGAEATFEQLYASGARTFAWSQAAKQILTVVPRYALEALSFGLIVLLVLVLLAVGESVAQVLPMLAVYGFAAYKLMPALQHVYSAFAQARYYSHTVDALYEDLHAVASAVPVPGHDSGNDADDDALQAVTTIPFQRSVAVRKLSFAYPSSREPVLEDIDLRIEKNSTVGLVGSTGCGKTTLVDVLMGLLEPQSGQITVDNRVLRRSGMAAWQRNFGYVPQQIFLSDDSIAANIAFGIPPADRDAAAVERAARTANLHQFVVGETPYGYDTVVGERGIRLSGGQCQRIGIARALYRDPAILVMDEATSALDSLTEAAVMDAIGNLMHRKTIIIIAHRITTVQPCDVIYLMERGRVVARGSYRELLNESPRFRAMAKVAVNT